MSKSVLISIQPYYVFLIIAKAMGWDIPQEKTIEVRKTIPRDKDWNRKAIIYCSKNKKSFAKIPRKYQPLMESFLGKVIGEFVCDGITEYPYETFNDGEHFMPYGELEKICLDGWELYEYLGIKDGYGWHISNLVIYDKPKELGVFQKYGALSYDDWLYGIYNGTSESNYENYLKPFKVVHAPQSWCYVERLVGEQ